MGCACKKISDTISNDGYDNDSTFINDIFLFFLKIILSLTMVILSPFILIVLIVIVIKGKSININSIIGKKK